MANRTKVYNTLCSYHTLFVVRQFRSQNGRSREFLTRSSPTKERKPLLAFHNLLL